MGKINEKYFYDYRNNLLRTFFINGRTIINTYKIEVYPRDTIYDEYNFQAVFDGYDGAPIDHETPSPDKIGNGDTEMEAILDLIEQSL